jgi:hypothetical protein
MSNLRRLVVQETYHHPNRCYYCRKNPKQGEVSYRHHPMARFDVSLFAWALGVREDAFRAGVLLPPCRYGLGVRIILPCVGSVRLPCIPMQELGHLPHQTDSASCWKSPKLVFSHPTRTGFSLLSLNDSKVTFPRPFCDSDKGTNVSVSRAGAATTTCRTRSTERLAKGVRHPTREIETNTGTHDGSGELPPPFVELNPLSVWQTGMMTGPMIGREGLGLGNPCSHGLGPVSLEEVQILGS